MNETQCLLWDVNSLVFSGFWILKRLVKDDHITALS